MGTYSTVGRLGSEDHRITERVRPEDTDPRTEVGIVGDTLNKLLDNVDSALAELAASHRRTRQFLTDASHELRTPLAAIRGYAELTRQDSAALPETTEYALARIESEAQRMFGLVEDLLLRDAYLPQERHALVIEVPQLALIAGQFLHQGGQRPRQ